jgi:hypothetical protein
MLRRGTHRIVIVIVLAAALLAPAAPLAAEPYGAAHASSWGLDALWAWARLWLGLPNSSPQKSTSEGGSSIDPNGTKSDAGLQIDPNGTKSDAGAHIDPDGAKNDAGAHIDPNG